MLTRKHFEIIAEELRKGRPLFPTSDDQRYEYDWAVEAVAKALIKINPRFDHARFRAATQSTEDSCSRI